MLSVLSFGQFEECHLVGPGSDDGGTNPASCGLTGNYSFQDSDGNVCIPPGNSLNTWSWCMDILGTPSFVMINQSTTFPVDFTLTNGVTGVITGASFTSVTIRWDCNSCTPGEVSHINLFFGCQSEVYQSSIFVECTSCSFEELDCVRTDCDCLRVCVGNVVVTLNNPGGNLTTFCFPAGTNIGQIAECGEVIKCEGDKTKGRRSFSDQNDKINHIKIPDVNITQMNRSPGATSLSIELPQSNQNFELVVSDNLGRIVHEEKLVNQYQAVVELSGLAVGIYHVLLTDGKTKVTQKIFVH